MDDVKQFFADYESALANSDIEKIGACYGDVFMFGGPQGVQPVKKEDFLKVIPKRKEYFASTGLKSTKVASVTSTAMDAKYTFVKTAWELTFDHGSRQIAASYILSLNDGRFQIVVQIDHQDLAQVANQR